MPFVRSNPVTDVPGVIGVNAREACRGTTEGGSMEYFISNTRADTSQDPFNLATASRGNPKVVFLFPRD